MPLLITEATPGQGPKLNIENRILRLSSCPQHPERMQENLPGLGNLPGTSLMKAMQRLTLVLGEGSPTETK